MNADQFAAEIKRLRDAFDNSTAEGARLCDELAIRPEIAEAAAKLAHMLGLVAGLDAKESSEQAAELRG